ncbi:hypothetical protein AAVH_28968 [Aphelenchoides avenae]|nr:hypothetical protein AAVH_28968 [Aphelenchus avenae]
MASDTSDLLTDDQLDGKAPPQQWNTWIACFTTVQVIAIVTYYFYMTVPLDPYNIGLFGVSVGLLFCLVPMVFYTFIGTPFLASIMYLILLGLQASQNRMT